MGSGGVGLELEGVVWVWVWFAVECDHGLGRALGSCAGMASRKDAGFLLSLLNEFLANAVLKALPTS